MLHSDSDISALRVVNSANKHHAAGVGTRIGLKWIIIIEYRLNTLRRGTRSKKRVRSVSVKNANQSKLAESWISISSETARARQKIVVYQKSKMRYKSIYQSSSIMSNQKHTVSKLFKFGLAKNKV